jgi:hypothetical protein
MGLLLIPITVISFSPLPSFFQLSNVAKASKATPKISSILAEIKILSTLFKSLDFKVKKQMFYLGNGTFIRS